MTHASLFSGIGGFDLAAEWAGFDNVFNCEIDPFCRRILNYSFPNTIQYGDIKTTDFTPWRGKIDILTGGFPCQPFSTAGKRKGTDDDRYLWPEMLRAISEIRPAWVIGENVGGIVSMVQPGCEVEVATQATLFGEDYYTTQERQEFIIERICRDIEHLGYSIQPILIPACGVGAPHRRDRVWFIAENTQCVRCDGDQSDEEPRTGRFWQLGAGDHVRVCGETGVVADSPNTGDKTMCGSEIGIHAVGVIADTLDEGLEGRIDCREQTEAGLEYNVRKNVTGCSERDATDTESERLPEWDAEQGRDGAYTATQRHDSIPSWANFPTQSPVCGGNDGLPGQLDGFTIPKWRQESIKGFGNAVVPQVVYQIFKTVNEYETKSSFLRHGTSSVLQFTAINS